MECLNGLNSEGNELVNKRMLIKNFLSGNAMFGLKPGKGTRQAEGKKPTYCIKKVIPGEKHPN